MKNNKEPKNKGEIIIYRTKDNKISLDVRLEKETIWLSQEQISSLFQKDQSVISRHINNIFKEKELRPESNMHFLHIANSDKPVAFYSLDAIISVGYRVNSQTATQFRIWATKILKNYLIKGFVVNQKRLKETNLTEFEQAVNLIKKTIETKKLDTRETKGLLKVITDYANSWILLQKYDKKQLEIKATGKTSYLLNYDETSSMVIELKNNLINKKQATGWFGTEKEKDGLMGILGNINQTFDNKELYPSIEEKAAHLLYFIIKDHVFIDGNKRIASFLFIVFLARNNYLFNKKGEKKFNDNALVALALLIAESNPKDKDLMIKLIMNFLVN